MRGQTGSLLGMSSTMAGGGGDGEGLIDAGDDGKELGDTVQIVKYVTKSGRSCFIVH